MTHMCRRHAALARTPSLMHSACGEDPDTAAEASRLTDFTTSPTPTEAATPRGSSASLRVEASPAAAGEDMAVSRPARRPGCLPPPAVVPSPNWRRTAGPTLVLLLALTLIGCSDDTPAATEDRSGSDRTTAPTSASPTQAPPESPTAPPLETGGPQPECGGLDLGFVRKVLAPDMRRHSADVSYCIFSRPRYARPTLVVTAVPTLGDPAEFAQEARDTCEGDLTDVPDVGDVAFVCTYPLYGPQGYVVEEDVFVQLDLASGDDEADLASLLELVPYVEVPTGLEIPE